MKMPDRNMIFHPAFIMLQLIPPCYLPLFTSYLPLTISYDKNIIHYDKQSCQTDKNNCHTEALYDTEG